MGTVDRMQVVLKNCGICGHSIQFETEGTWCGECRTVFHSECLAAAGHVCTRCLRRAIPPEERFAFSKSCGVCGAASCPPARRCSQCGHPVCWDTREEYEAYRSGVRNHARSCFWIACAEIPFGVLALGLSVLLLYLAAAGPFGFFHFAIPLAGIALLADGFRRMSESRRLSKFE